MTSASSSLLVRASVAVALVAAAPLALAAATCESLKTLALADTQIDSSATVAPGQFKDANTPWAPPAQLPEHCRVQGTIRPTSDSDIKFEVWLPVPAHWNGKFQGVGNGGFAGSINYHFGLVEALQRGYAAASTDTGHKGGSEDAIWGKGHPEKVVDYGHRAVHLTTVNAKAIVKAFYGEPHKRAYFAACSNGGRQALMTAQRYPEDYDGIIAGAPANDWTGLMLSFIWNARAALQPDAFIPATSSAMIETAVNEQCDALDGVKDGVVGAAKTCAFRPAKLLCAQGQTNACLTAPQVAALESIYQGARAGSTQLMTGFTPGGEVGTIPGIGWDGWVFGPKAGAGTQGRFANNFMRGVVVGDDAWQPTDFNFERDAQGIIDKYGPILNATDPDLSRFAARGGKLIMFHGWADAAVPPLNSIKYFDSVGARMGTAKRAEFARLFMAPGMQHCFAGPGPSFFGGNTAAALPPDPSGDLSAAMEQWVEKHIAPETVRAVKPKNLMAGMFDSTKGGVERTGLLCAYPKVATWNGKGSADDAASYTCVEPERVVRIDSGELAGVVQGDVVSFKGIPYVAPPVGTLRWRAPEPAAAWSGVRKADKVGALCMQKINPADNGVGPPPASEDCLTLNVFAPVNAIKAPVPVMYWIHGGGFVNGSGTAALYDGTELAKLGVVVVTINYRLGRFGFFAHPALTKENPAGPQANFALMDMMAGLQWVKRNIAAFGGDASNVTIFGESAGGAAVNQLMISPPARGLFHKAISQSGLGRERRAHLDRAGADGQPSAHDDGVAFATKLGVKADDLVALRAVSADTIVANTDSNVGPGPIIEGNLVPEDIAPAFRAGHQAKVPYMAGSNALEFPFYSDSLPGAIGRMIRFEPEERARIVAAYGGEDTFKTNVLSDVLFTEGARHIVRAHAKAGQVAYLYRFSVLPEAAPPQIKGTPHAQERQYVFKTLSTSPWKTNARDERAADLAAAYWVAFAKTGNPNGNGRPEWPASGQNDQRIFELTNDGPVMSPVPNAAALDVISARY